LPAEPIAFDPTDDIAVLRVPNLSAPSLTIDRSPAAGTAGAILGYPGDGPFRAQPGRIGRTQTGGTQDAYGRGPVTRRLTPLRGVVRAGNAGGRMVDGSGRVLTPVFAGTVGGASRGGYGVANRTVATILAEAAAAASRAGPVDTGPCTAG